MPVEAFHRLDRQPGFKYEYVDGRAQISVHESASAVVVTRPSILRGRCETASLPRDTVLQLASDIEAEEIAAAWFDAFHDTADYHGYPIEAIREDIQSECDRLYPMGDGDLHPASVVTRRKSAVVGALLVTRRWARPFIATVFVDRTVRRQGVASVMADRVAQEMVSRGDQVIGSNYLLANRGSGAWHAAMGFVEIPSWILVQHRYQSAGHNLKWGRPRDIFGARQHVRWLREHMDQLESAVREDPEGAAPSLWFKRDGDRVDQFVHQHVPDEAA
jgi:GNAT superfamily N-acetyltransferase